MRKSISMLLIAAMTVSLTACGGSQTVDVAADTAIENNQTEASDTEVREAGEEDIVSEENEDTDQTEENTEASDTEKEAEKAEEEDKTTDKNVNTDKNNSADKDNAVNTGTNTNNKDTEKKQEDKKENNKKEDSKKEDSKKENNKKEDSKKEDSKKENNKKEDSKKEDSKKENNTKDDKKDNKNEDSKKDDTKKENLGQALLSDFKKRMKNNASATPKELADGLINNEAILFAGGTAEVEPGWLSGFDEEITGFKAGATFGPMMGSIAFVGYVFELEDEKDTADFMADLKSKANPRWQICVEADATLVSSVGSKVFFVMWSQELEE